MSLERSLHDVPGVVSARLHFASGALEVVYATPDAESAVRARVAQMGFRLVALDTPPDVTLSFWQQHGTLVFTGIAAGCWVLGGLLLLTHSDRAATVAFAAAILFGGLPIFRRALTAIRARSLDLYVLMTIAVIGAAALGEWGEGASVVVLFAIGNALEGLTTRRARASIGALIERAPERATVMRDGKEIVMRVEEVVTDDTVIVRPGEKIPLDGRVIAGSSSVNESTITGESAPRLKSPGDTVYAGTFNEQGALECLVTQPYAQSTFARILRLIESAQDSKPRMQQRIDRFARYYTPAIVIFAVVVAVSNWALGVEEPIRRALPLLIIGCPCALVLASPIALIAAISHAARRGILIKEGLFLETGAHIQVVAFDKTGTLTTGHPRITDITPAEGTTADQLLSLAATLEYYSEHPLGRAIRHAARDHHLSVTAPTTFHATPGLGVEGEIDTLPYRLGSPRLWSALPVEWSDAATRAEAQGGTVLLLGTGETIMGILVLSDAPRPEAANVVETLSARGYTLRILSGDTRAATERLGATVGIATVNAELLPDEKVAIVRELRSRYGPVAMVGDGMNDAPALASTDLGIAMAAAGNATTVENADIVLVSDDLTALPAFLALSHRTAAIISQNIVFAVLVKVALILLALVIILPLWLAVIGDVGTTILVILNGMRLLK